MLSAIIAEVDVRSSEGVAAAVSRLVRSGELAAGSRLPTVRALAAALGTSPTTVSQAWRALSRAGVISPRGRQGTFVQEPNSPPPSWRSRRTMGSPGAPALDLSTGTPDLALLPVLTEVLRCTRPDPTRTYHQPPVIAELEEVLRARWPFVAEALTVVDGAMDALDRLTGVLVGVGSYVLVENPCYPWLLDLLDVVGAVPVPLALDPDGIVPASLAQGLQRDPAVLFLQPRAQNPTGISMTQRRAAELAGLLRGSRTVIVEDDHCGDVAGRPVISLGVHLPEKTAHIHSFSKSYGPDLRLAAIGGAGSVVEEVANRRMLGPGWSSRLLQSVLVDLLRDPATQRRVGEARTAYGDRRRGLLDALAAAGVRATGSDGINVWVEVDDEQHALLALATRGIGVAPGSPFLAAPLPRQHIRVTAGLIRADLPGVASAIADAARDPHARPAGTWAVAGSARGRRQ